METENKLCYGCGRTMLTLSFYCPCDLTHPMCIDCLNNSQIKKDCAYFENNKLEAKKFVYQEKA